MSIFFLSSWNRLHANHYSAGTGKCTLTASRIFFFYLAVPTVYTQCYNVCFVSKGPYMYDIPKMFGLSQRSSPYRTFCYLYNISVRISGEPLPLPRWTSYMNGRYLLLIRINKAFCFIFGIRWFSQDRSALMNSAWNTHTIYFSNGNQKVGSCSMTRLFGDKSGNSFKRHISRYNITRLGICKWRHRCAMDHIYS